MGEEEPKRAEAPASSERTLRLARRASAEAAAATAILLDRDAWPTSAVVHVLDGWSALADALCPDASGPLPERITAARVPGLADAAQARLAEDLARIAAAPRDREDAVDRRELRRLSRELHVAAARALRAQGAGAGRWKWAAAGLAAVALAVGLVWGGSASERAGAARAHGWLGRYYPALDFGGEPVVRYDEAIDFDWLGEPPVDGVPADHYTVRWDTCLEVPTDDTIELRIGSDDGSRVFVDGEQVLDNWRDQAGNWKAYQARLAEGVHHVRVEYYENGGNALAILELTGAAGPVPESWFRPPRLSGGDVACGG